MIESKYLKLPQDLPELTEIAYVLAEPEWVQVGALLIFGLGGCLCGALFVKLQLEPSVPFWPKLVLALMAICFLSIVLRPRMRERWIWFIADKPGCFFRRSGVRKNFVRDSQSGFLHVPWTQVNQVRIETRHEEGGNVRMVVVEIKVDDLAWENELSQESSLPRWLRVLKTHKDENGFRSFPLGNHCRDPEQTLAEIERVRRQSKPN